MGNCLHRCGKSRSAVAADEETQSYNTRDVKTGQEDAASSGVQEGVSSSGTEVKIKMTKKEMKELFTKVEKQGMDVGVVIAELLENRTAAVEEEGGDVGGYRVNGGGGDGDLEMRRQQSWRPMLHSIPEI